MKPPIYDLTKGETPYLQRYVVPLESGAIYLCHVMAESPPDGEAAAMRAAADQGDSVAWDTPAAVPGPRAGQPTTGPDVATGIELLRGPDVPGQGRPAADPGPDLPARYVSIYFAQGEEAARDLDYIEERGAESFLHMMAGAVDLSGAEGEETAVAPWGAHDTLRHSEGIPGGILYLHSCPGGNYL